MQGCHDTWRRRSAGAHCRGMAIRQACAHPLKAHSFFLICLIFIIRRHLWRFGGEGQRAVSRSSHSRKLSALCFLPRSETCGRLVPQPAEFSVVQRRLRTLGAGSGCVIGQQSLVPRALSLWHKKPKRRSIGTINRPIGPFRHCI